MKKTMSKALGEALAVLFALGIATLFIALVYKAFFWIIG